MDSHVSDGPGAEVPATAPFEGDVIRVVWAFRCGAEPEVPVECFWDGWRPSWAFFSLWPPAVGAIGPDVEFFDLADGAGTDDFYSAAGAFHGVALLAHLGDNAGFFSFLLHPVHLVDRVGKGFFAVNMESVLHSGDGGNSVGMIRGADDDGVEVFGLLVEHGSKVAVAGGVRVFAIGIGCAGVVDVSESDDVFGGESREVGESAAAWADESKVKFVFGGKDAAFLTTGAGGEAEAGKPRGMEEFAAGGLVRDFHRMEVVGFRWKAAVVSLIRRDIVMLG